MEDSAFWRERQNEFETFHQQYPEWTANWNPSNNSWWFQDGSSHDGIAIPAKEADRLLNAVARRVSGTPDTPVHSVHEIRFLNPGTRRENGPDKHL